MRYTLSHQGREYSATFKKNIRRYINLYNAVIKLLFFARFVRIRAWVEQSTFKELKEIRMRALQDTDISDHLEIMFLEALEVKPKLIVELGTRTGESTFAFERVARLCNSQILSVDIEPLKTSSTWHKWNFIMEDDLILADRFPKWCAEKGLEPKIDVLFIDTSHEYNQTKNEIAKWFPFLSETSKVFFHDANVRLLYKRRNGTIGKAYNDDRDVMRAIEEYLGTKFDQTRDFVDFNNSWLVKHRAICNGMTILQKIK